MNNKVLGFSGESQAAKLLKTKKYKIIATNYVCPIGEIDIIANDKNVIVFVEVKTRLTEKYGLPREAVTRFKQQKLKNLAKYYLKNHNLLDCPARFDVIEVFDGETNHIINAFY
ncbi:MAG: YraN family protein [Clostridia bacterium]|jgi:putative endonuclease|nr:YraN family protein [Clostridia bacterium]MDD4275790.1 YraN family protein [Clostridia bacterium]